jgi:hypothetical protein
MHGSMGGERKPAPVGKSARSQAPLAYPTDLDVGLRSLTEGVDTTTAGGRMTFTSSARWPSLSAASSRAHPRRPGGRPASVQAAKWSST